MTKSTLSNSDAMFWIPERLTEPDSWTGHIPFAFWVVEATQPRTLVELGTQSGNSYFAFCHAVDQLGLNATCFAVDTWKGDEHSGIYGEEIYGEMRAYHDERYGRFSRLVRSTFDDALAHFADHSIDVLHIDGCHTYDAIAHDFKSWFPKVSDRGVVLLHDITVRERGFGVWRLWAELSSEFPCFSFSHSHGLGILAVGRSVPPKIERLCRAERNKATKARIQARFQRLGEAVSQSLALKRIRCTLTERQAELEAVRAETSRQLSQRDRDIRILAYELRAAQKEGADREQAMQALHMELATKAQSLAKREEQLGVVTHEQSRLAAQLENLSTLVSERDHEVERLARKVSDRNERIEELSNALAARDRKLHELINTVASQGAEIQRLTEELQAAQAVIADRDREIRRLGGELSERDEKTDGLSNQLNTAQRILADRDMELRAVFDSTSWRVTAPLRAVKTGFVTVWRVSISRFSHYVRAMVGRTARNVYRRLPVSYERKRRMKNLVYRYLGFLIRDTVSYKYWVITQRSSNNLARAEQAPEHREISGADLASAVYLEKEPDVEKNRMGPIEDWQEYRNILQRFLDSHAGTLMDLNPNRPKMISINEFKVDVYAASLQFQAVIDPLVSIVIPVYDNIKFTLECLLSVLTYSAGIPHEIIVVDDASTDRTQQTLSNIKNIIYVRNPKNLGFVRACNGGAKSARGKYILFLNNDVQVTEGWLSELLRPFEESANVGAVGPKILYPNGRLQEAGGRINRDCSTQLIGLSDDPDLSRYNYLREVDYCSCVCLIVEARKFNELGGFEDSFAPAYCEDVDLCLRLRSQGLRILYNPKSVIVHHLSATSAKVDRTFKQQCVVRNQQKLTERWQKEIDALNQVRLIAFYLPQYHPIPENDRWWGKGFTEWTNVTKARPNFVGHYQPHLPADLGLYDLRVQEVMEHQSDLAKRHGIYGFCYLYYWFAGKRLLEMPLERMLKTGRPDFPFCLCWANENWTRRWDGLEHEILIGQRHSDEDDKGVIRDIVRYLRHANYIRIDGKPLLLIYRVNLFPDIKRTTEIWRDICRDEGVGEIYLAMVESFEHALAFEDPSKYGFDASVEYPPHGMSAPIESPGAVVNPDYSGFVNDYRELVLKYMRMEIPGHIRFRAVMPSWDNTPRRPNDSIIFAYNTPGAYQAWLEVVLRQTREQNFGEERIVFINAWNEWAEGNHLEPDRRFGHAFLEATHNALNNDLLEGR